MAMLWCHQCAASCLLDAYLTHVPLAVIMPDQLVAQLYGTGFVSA